MPSSRIDLKALPGLWRAGVSLEELSERFKVGKPAVRIAAKKLGLEERPRAAYGSLKSTMTPDERVAQQQVRHRPPEKPRGSRIAYAEVQALVDTGAYTYRQALCKLHRQRP